MRIHATLHMKDIYTILKGNSIYLITLIVVFVIFTVLCNFGISDWPQYQQEGFNSGVTSERFPEYPIILWFADIQRVDVTPVICDSALYVIAGAPFTRYRMGGTGL